MMRMNPTIGALLMLGLLAAGCGGPQGAAPATDHLKNSASSVTKGVTEGTNRAVSTVVPPAARHHARRALEAVGRTTKGRIHGSAKPAAVTRRGAHRPTQVIAFFATGSTTRGPSAGLSALASHPRSVSALSPLFYTLRADGSLVSHVDPKVVAFARSHHIPLIPLVNNAGGTAAPLMNGPARTRALTAIEDVVMKNGYAGVNVDFQLLPNSARVGLNQFVDDLSTALRPKGKSITVDVIPGAQTRGAHAAYDEYTLARYSDGLVLMTYDHHSDSSPPGPVAPITWVRDAVVHALQAGVPANKILLGVNTYGYTWNTTTHSATTTPMKATAALPKHFVPAAQEATAHYTNRAGHHVVWVPDRKSLRAKLALVRRYHLKGIAIWKVGDETRGFWVELDRLNGTRPAPAAPAKSAAGRPATTVAVKGRQAGQTVKHGTSSALNAMRGGAGVLTRAGPTGPAPHNPGSARGGVGMKGHHTHGKAT